LAVPDLKATVAEIVRQLGEARSLESLRKPLGIHKGRIGNLDPENAFLSISHH
jgi:hypothetical protein